MALQGVSLGNDAATNAANITAAIEALNRLQERLADIQQSIADLRSGKASTASVDAKADLALVQQLQATLKAVAAVADGAATGASVTALARGKADVAYAQGLEALIYKRTEDANFQTFKADTLATLATILQAISRPGDAPVGYTLAAGTKALGGPAGELLALPPAILTAGDAGAAVRLTGAAVLLQRQATALVPGHVYRARVAIQRRVDTPDVANHAVRIGIVWLDQGQQQIPGSRSIQVVRDYTALRVATGRQVLSFTLARASAAGIDFPALPVARFARLFVQSFGQDAGTDVEILSLDDVTDTAILPPLSAAVEARVATIESLDSGSRLAALEAAQGTPTALTFRTLPEARAATIPAGITALQLLGVTASGDVAPRTYRRRPVQPKAGVFFQTQDGGWWQRVDAQQDMTIAGGQSVVFRPIDNATQAVGSHVLTATTAQNELMEFCRAVMLYSTTGKGQYFTKGARVADFVGLAMLPGSGHAFAQNIVLDVGAGVGNITAVALEIDISNFNQDYNQTTIDASQEPYGAAVLITGFGDKSIGACIVVDGGQDTFKTTRLFAAYNGHVTHNCFEDYMNAAGSWAYISAQKYAAIDCTPATLLSGATIRQPNDKALAWRNRADTVDVLAVKLDATDTLLLGQGATGGISAAGSLRPGAANAFTLGLPGAPWAAIYSANGVITTSDARLKTDVTPLPDGILAVVRGVRPRTFRWLEGGLEETEVEEEQDVPVVEEIEVEVPHVERQGETFVRATRRQKTARAVTRTVPVLGDDGRPLVEIRPARPEQPEERDPATGAVIRPRVPATPEQRVAVTHEVPVTERRRVVVRKLLPRAGRRTHWGFLADEVGAALKATGRDFGGYVEAADGTQALRSDQLIPVLWKALQEEAAAREAVEARLAAV